MLGRDGCEFSGLRGDLAEDWRGLADERCCLTREVADDRLCLTDDLGAAELHSAGSPARA
jgi:hypothetical protein